MYFKDLIRRVLKVPRKELVGWKNQKLWEIMKIENMMS